MFRTNEQPRAFESEFRKNKIPYVLIGGMSFFDRTEVRDVLSYLKLLAIPHDEVSLLRIINTPPRGIGKPTITQLLESAVTEGSGLWEHLLRQSANASSKPMLAVKKFCQLLETYRARLKTESLSVVAKSLLDEIGYEGELRRRHEQPHDFDSRWAAVEEVINALTAFERKHNKPDLLAFLNDLALDGQDFGSEKDNQLRRNSVVLMTLHSAKGLEFPHVYMVGMEEGLLPHHRSVDGDDNMIEEERRLCYVGVTRAQEFLTLSLALTRLKWGKPRESKPSRFLFELIGKAQRV